MTSLGILTQHNCGDQSLMAVVCCLAIRPTAHFPMIRVSANETLQILKNSAMWFCIPKINCVMCIIHLYLHCTIIIYLSDRMWSIMQCRSTFRGPISLQQCEFIEVMDIVFALIIFFDVIFYYHSLFT